MGPSALTGVSYRWCPATCPVCPEHVALAPAGPGQLQKLIDDPAVSREELDCEPLSL